MNINVGKKYKNNFNVIVTLIEDMDFFVLVQIVGDERSGYKKIKKDIFLKIYKELNEELNEDFM